ncbi:ABC transporter substrate-binding protein [Sciscionella marina]|uniref:ABC transporter substrate-binding protein n=1 Tax=Sciscionella marina TaxID=508770 RepID=UPI00035DA294|nr:ABC transporter substrate-binding protein [Sciscionella marina]
MRWLSCVALLLLLAGCATNTEERGLVLQVGDQKGQTKSLLAASGLLRTLPFRIQFSTFTSGPPEVEAANAGAIDTASVGNTPALIAAAANADVSMVAAAQGAPSGDTILVPRNSPIRDLKSLRGKTIGVANSTSAHGHLLAQLRRAGMTKDDVHIAYLQPADAFAAFSQGDLDAWAIWDPYTSQAQIREHARVLLDGTGVANALNFQVTSRKALADPRKAEAIRALVVATAKAQRWSQSHPEQWARAYAHDTGLPLAVARLDVSRGVQLPVPLTGATVRSEQQLMDVFVANNSIPQGIRFGDFVDDRYDKDLQPFQEKGIRQ